MKLGVIFCALFFSLSAAAATRDVYFSVVGRNYVKTGLPNAERSRCIITIFNNSNVEQQYKLNMASSISNLNGTPAGLTTDPSNGSFAAIAAGGAVTKTAIFPVINANTVNQTQDVTCAGSITVTDTTTPGFITANGSLVTFYQSGAQVTLTSTTQNYGQQAVFTQINVPINNGKPF